MSVGWPLPYVRTVHTNRPAFVPQTAPSVEENESVICLKFFNYVYCCLAPYEIFCTISVAPVALPAEAPSLVKIELNSNTITISCVQRKTPEQQQQQRNTNDDPLLGTLFFLSLDGTPRRIPSNSHPAG